MYKILFICIILPFSLFAQEAKNNNSLKVTVKKASFFNTEKERIAEESFNDSLKSGLYIVNVNNSIKNETGFYLVRKHLDSSFLDKKVPKIEFYNMSREKVALETEKCFLLTFWNVNCVPCAKKLMVLDSLAAVYTGVTFWAITRDSVSAVQKYIKMRKFKNIIFIPEYKDEFGMVFPIYVYPTNIFLNGSQEIKSIFYDKNIKEIEEILQHFSKQKSTSL